MSYLTSHHQIRIPGAFLFSTPRLSGEEHCFYRSVESEVSKFEQGVVLNVMLSASRAQDATGLDLIFPLRPSAFYESHVGLLWQQPLRSRLVKLPAYARCSYQYLLSAEASKY